MGPGVPPRRSSGRAPGRWGPLLGAAIVAELARAQVPAPPAATPAPTVAAPAALPDVPAQVPERYAVMAFENRSGVHVLDWAIAGLPLVIGEKLERVSGLAPAYDPWVVPAGPVVPAAPAAVAAFAQARGARWVITGWVERPDWQLRLHVAVWKLDGGQATIAGEREAVGPIEQPHALVGSVATGALVDAGWRLAADAAAVLGNAPSADPYAFTLFGRGVGKALGNLGPVDRAAAARDLGRAVFIDPNLVVGQRLLGLVWSTDPDPAIAKKAAGKFAYAADLDPGYPAAVRAVAERAAASGDWPAAATGNAQLVRARPWDLDARVALGLAAWRSGDAALALAELGRVVARRPDDLAAHRVLAEIAGARGELSTRVSELEIVARLAPADLDAVVELASAYAEAGRLADATTRFEQVAAARPTDATAAKRVGDLYRRRGDVDAAVRWYAGAAKLAPSDPRPLLLSGATLLDAGRFREAREVLARAQRFVEYQAGTWTALGAAAYLEGKHAEALIHWRRAGLARPRSAAIRYDLALAASASGDLARARAQLAVVDQLAPKDADAAYLRGVIALRAGDDAEARAAFLETTRRDPGHADARANLAALGRGQPLRFEGKPRIELPFGDRAALVAALDRFAAASAQLAALRAAIEGHALAILGELGEGPSKDPLRSRLLASQPCPISAVATRWAQALAARDRFIATGVELEDAYQIIATYDRFGETDGGSPIDRQRVEAAHAGYRAARHDVLELKVALDNQVQRELTRRHCTADLLAAAAADPSLYRIPDAARATPRVTRTEPTPIVATFMVDNRECAEPVAVFIDGEWVGEVLAREQTAIAAPAGRRTLCLVPQPGRVACGDRGTVRDVYVYDGWSLRMRCPRDK
ncbi:MAG: tetratricopeptide repeat protein [Myxococcales bacterium]|nr:tetratricopeptide repeat protein [Myxococcales bacterium]